MKCLDTYVLVEILSGNELFTELLKKDVVITDLTMAEFYSFLYRKFNLRTAEYWHRKLKTICRPVEREILLKAVAFRADSKENFSFFDVVGYIFACENNMKFVTGDKEFMGMEDVDFISNEK